MWFIETTLNNKTIQRVIIGNFDETHNDGKNVLCGLVIGRQNCDLNFENTIVSRKHCKLYLHINNNDINNIKYKPRLSIIDLSRFGTKLNNKEIPKNTHTFLKENDTVILGNVASKFTVKWKDIIVGSSRLSSEDRQMLDKYLLQMSCKIIRDKIYNDNITHLIVHEDGLVTQKMLHSLINNKYIVTLKYIKYIVKNKEIPNMENEKYITLFIPKSLLEMIPYKKYYRNIIRNNGRNSNVRKSLFNGRMFYFTSNNTLEQHNDIIQNCGGMSALLSGNIEGCISEHKNNLGASGIISYICVVHNENDRNEEMTIKLKKLGFIYIQSNSIANAILSSKVYGAENEITWTSLNDYGNNNNNDSQTRLDSKKGIFCAHL